MRLAAVAATVALVATISLPASQQSPTALARSGFEALAAGRAQQAAALFDEALATSPQEPKLLLGAGIAAQMLGRPDDARRHLLTALKYDPALTAASLALGEVLYRAGDLEGAINIYDLAIGQPGVQPAARAQLARKTESWRKELDLHSRFGQRLGDHFTVLFEGPAEAQLAERAVEILESAYWRIGSALFTYPPDVITVVLYTREQFRDITQSPAWAGGAFDGRIRVPVQGALQNAREFERVLAHEFTHALVKAVAPRTIPVWLDEGLAVYFEGSDRARKREVVKTAPALLPFERLERSFEGLREADARLAYAQSAVAVDVLIELAGTQGMANLLADLGAGARFADALERHVFVSYRDLEQRIASARGSG